MSRAFGNRTADLTSSQYLNFKKSKVNYNYLRLLSEFNIEECDNIIFSDFNGNSSLKKINKMEGNGNDAVKVYSKLIATDSYDLKQSINRGFYLPTFINTNGNIVVNRAPFSFDPLCKELPNKYPWQKSINSSGDLQEILQYEYLDFGTQIILTNIDFVSFYKQNTIEALSGGKSGQWSNPTKTLFANQIVVTDASFGDFILDPTNLFTPNNSNPN